MNIGVHDRLFFARETFEFGIQKFRSIVSQPPLLQKGRVDWFRKMTENRRYRVAAPVHGISWYKLSGGMGGFNQFSKSMACENNVSAIGTIRATGTDD